MRSIVLTLALLVLAGCSSMQWHVERNRPLQMQDFPATMPPTK